MIDISNRKKINIRDKKITVIGLGTSGTAAATLANHLGARVFGSDSSENFQVSNNALYLLNNHIASETGLHSKRIYDADLWIISPGIPNDADIVKKAQDRGIPIVGEIEFASWYTDSPIVAVTGSNGKTTTVNILSEMCQSENVQSNMAGNMGIPFSERVLTEIKSQNKIWHIFLRSQVFKWNLSCTFVPKLLFIQIYLQTI